MHDRHFLFDRQARDLLSGNPQTGTRSRPHRRISHLVARDPDQQETDRTAAHRGDRKRPQRGEMGTDLGTRNSGLFSCDLASFDFKASSPKQVIDVPMKKLDKLGKGIILMHDFHKHTAEALPEWLRKLKDGGYKVVQMKAKAPVQTIAQYDDDIVKDVKLPTVSSR